MYVTGGPDLLIGRFEANPIPQKVVSTNHFPDGEICLHKLGESTEDYKVRTITALMKRDEYSTFDFILIGDNGERDIVTYTRVKHDTEVGTRVRQVFIHKIYSGGSSLEPLDEQHPFITAADLAALLQGFGFITEEDLIEVINIVSAGMKDNGQDHNLTLPFAAQLVPDQVNAIFGSLSTTIGAPADALLHNLHELVLKQAKEGPRRF